MTLGLRLLGMGAMASPRYAPAGLLVRSGAASVMLDGGPGAEPPTGVAVVAWLVSDAQGELRAALRRLAAPYGLVPAVGEVAAGPLSVRPLAVVHTSHPTWGYLIEEAGRRVVWAPELWEWPRWAGGADLAFVEAAGWDRPIRFAGGVGGHAAALDVARWAQDAGVRRVVLAHVGRPSLRAMDAGRRPPFGEWGRQGANYRVRHR